MPFDLIIRGGTVVTPDGLARLDVAVEGGAIVELTEDLRGAAREEIDATGLHVFPGLIDAHVHFNEPGRTDWEGFDTGSAALAAGGGTCFFDMPLNAHPPTLDGDSFDLKLAAALTSSRTDFALWGGLTPQNLDTMEELADRGVVGFKAFMCNSGIDDFAAADGPILLDGMRRAAKVGLPVAVHAESQPLTFPPRPKSSSRDARIKAFLESRPVIAETTAIARAIDMAAEAGCSLHVVHVSSWRGVDLVREGRSRGIDVTCETCPHYLALTEQDAYALAGRAKCAPPLRPESERSELWNRVVDRHVTLVGSDHSPAPPELKSDDDFLKLWGGVSGVQSTLPALLSHNPALPLEAVAALTAQNVASRFRVQRKGQVGRGYDADLALVDVSAEYELTRDMLLDRHKLSPYVGRRFRGLVRRTMVRGHTVFRDGKTVGSFRGRLVKPTRGTAARSDRSGPADA
jgi:allantoinase